MTVTLKTKFIPNGRYAVIMELDKTGIYKVSICSSYDYGKTYSSPIRERTYWNIEKATRCYYRYCSEAKKMS